MLMRASTWNTYRWGNQLSEFPIGRTFVEGRTYTCSLLSPFFLIGYRAPLHPATQEDEQRVSQLFLEADTAGIAVQQRSLTSQELQEVALTGACLVIALVDKRKLDSTIRTKPSPVSTSSPQATPSTSSSEFAVGGDPTSRNNAGSSLMDSTSSALPSSSSSSSHVASSGDGEYMGHYVVIFGYDAASGEFLLRDPATPVSELRVGANALDLARR